MRKRTWLGLLLLTILVLTAIVGLDQRLIVRKYTVKSDKVTAPVRLAVLAD